MGKVRITIDYEEIDVILQALIMFDTDLEEFKCLEKSRQKYEQKWADIALKYYA